MFRRSILAIVSVAFAAFIGLAAPKPALAQNALPSGLSYPIAATTAQGTFNGALRIVAFGVQNGVVVASGIVSGTVINGTTISAVSQTVTIPVNMGAKAATAAATTAASAAAGAAASTTAPAAGSCGILNLVLGPLHLDLLGLVIDLNQVVLNVDAVPGAGNLLGNLLCSVTNLLNNGGAATQIANILNQILGLLG